MRSRSAGPGDTAKNSPRDEEEPVLRLKKRAWRHRHKGHQGGGKQDVFLKLLPKLKLILMFHYRYLGCCLSSSSNLK